MVMTTRSTEQRLESLEKAVEDLTIAVGEIQTSKITIETKLDIILQKLSASDGERNEDESEDSHDPTNTKNDQTATPLQVLQKMDLPSFDGSDALAWLARAEQYFLVHETPVDQRLKLALIAMSGPAMSWIQLLLRRCPKLEWSRFSRELLIRFGDGKAINRFEALVNTIVRCRQSGSLEDYISEFEGRLSQLPEFSDEQYLGFFLGGLKENIRVQIQDPTITDYSAAIQMARKVDGAIPPSNLSARSTSIGSFSSRPVYNQRPPPAPSQASSHPLATIAGSLSASGP